VYSYDKSYRHLDKILFNKSLDCVLRFLTKTLYFMSSLTTPTDSQKCFNRQDWQGGYVSQPQEFDYPITDIEGQIPAELQGTLFRNGPGLLDVQGEKFQHPFDGDGMITAISFDRSQAYVRSRYVQTAGYMAEKKAGKILYRGVFGTQKAGGWLANFLDLRLKNIANTNVLYWGNKLLALWEAAQPHSLDPHTLETIGLDDLGGIAEGAFAAHPRIQGDRLINFSIDPGLSSKITTYEINPDWQLTSRHTYIVPGFCFIHDFVVTDNYCIFFQNPISFNPLPYVFGLRSPGECIRFDSSKPTKILVMSGGQPVQTFETRAGFVFHHANAWESAGQLHIDSICYEKFPDVEPGADFRDIDFDRLAPGQLWRFTIDLQSQQVSRKLLESRCCEFPALNPSRVGRPYRYVYMGVADQPEGNAPLQGILKLDLETGEKADWSAAPRGFVGEPVFVPRPGSTIEDDGWVLSLVYDASRHRSYLAILAANSCQLIAKLNLQHHIPYGLHGFWTGQILAR